MSTNSPLRGLIPAILVLAAALAWHAGANSNVQRPPAQPTAVATIDIVEIFENLKERQVLEAQLQERLRTRQAQLEEVTRRLRALQEDLNPETGTIRRGTDAYYERLRELTEQRAVGQARSQALQQIISIDQGNLRRQLYEKVAAAVRKIAERDGLDLVLFDDSKFEIPENASNDEVYRAIVTKGIIYKHPTIDITQRVITLMNNEYTAP